MSMRVKAFTKMVAKFPGDFVDGVHVAGSATPEQCIVDLCRDILPSGKGGDCIFEVQIHGFRSQETRYYHWHQPTRRGPASLVALEDPRLQTNNLQMHAFVEGEERCRGCNTTPKEALTRRQLPYLCHVSGSIKSRGRSFQDARAAFVNNISKDAVPALREANERIQLKRRRDPSASAGLVPMYERSITINGPDIHLSDETRAAMARAVDASLKQWYEKANVFNWPRHLGKTAELAAQYEGGIAAKPNACGEIVLGEGVSEVRFLDANGNEQQLSQADFDARILDALERKEQTLRSLRGKSHEAWHGAREAEGVTVTMSDKRGTVVTEDPGDKASPHVADGSTFPFRRPTRPSTLAIMVPGDERLAGTMPVLRSDDLRAGVWLERQVPGDDGKPVTLLFQLKPHYDGTVLIARHNLATSISFPKIPGYKSWT